MTKIDIKIDNSWEMPHNRPTQIESMISKMKNKEYKFQLEKDIKEAEETDQTYFEVLNDE